MRVSVVATGIDQETIGQIEPVNVHARPEPLARPRGFQPARSARPASADSTAAAAAMFVAQDGAAGSVAAFPEPIEPYAETNEAAPAEFIPPAPEQPAARTPRMPQIEDLPQVAQNQLRAMRGEAQPVSAPETRRRSLLEKLAAFGITRHEEEATLAPVAAAPPAAVVPLPRPHVAAPVDAARAQQRPQPPRPLGALDPNGRAIPRPPVSEDDHLDIPAFLRRQS